MNPSTSPSPKRTEWRPLFLAALFETNKWLVIHRVLEAEAAISGRLRELSYYNDTLCEKEAMESALYALRIVRGQTDFLSESVLVAIGVLVVIVLFAFTQAAR